jgi:hypothetical protein
MTGFRGVGLFAVELAAGLSDFPFFAGFFGLGLAPLKFSKTRPPPSASSIPGFPRKLKAIVKLSSIGDLDVYNEDKKAKAEVEDAAQTPFRPWFR